MPRGRTSRKAAFSRAVSSVIEPLEQRQMLTTLQGGDTFDYIDAKNNIIRVQLTGNIVAEFIAARVRPRDNTVVIRDLVPAPFPTTPPTVTDGADLYHIYIAAADETARISISEVVRTTGFVTPYASNVGPIQVGINAPPPFVPTLITPEGGGSVYIGARTKDLASVPGTNEANIPIIYNRYRSDYGVRPGSAGIYAGIQTAPGVSMGRVLIGGTVTGRAFFDGNIETFYANDILTGDISGGFGAIANNIFVAGDIRNLLTQGSIGAVSTTPGYSSGTEIRVGGKLGNIRTGDEFVAGVQVINNPDISGIIGPYREIEGRSALVPNDVEFIAGEVTATALANNPATSTQFGSSGISPITGLTQSLDFAGDLDTLDNFSVPLIAGQRINVLLQVQDAAGMVGIFDPLGRLVATDIADPGGAGLNQSFQFTAELPGTYRFAVGLDSTFTGPVGFIGGVPYTLSISEYGVVAAGGIRAGGNLSLTGPTSGLRIRTGDLGSIWADDTVSGDSLNPHVVLKGNYRHLHGGVISGVDLVVPRGSVGYVDSDDSINMNDSAVDEDGAIPGYAVGFDYQRIEADGVMLGNFVANRAIGTIIADSIPGAPQFIANADNRGEDGRIDLIQVTGDFGFPLIGGPGLYTGLGGNVKYIKVGGTVYRDPFFGGATTTDFTLAPGQSISLTDDSGATATIAPTNVITPPTGTQTAPTITPGQLTLTPYGVRESGGVVLINLESDTSVNVSVTNGVGSFDIGTLTTGGTGTPVVYDPDLEIVQFEPPPSSGGGGGGGGGGGTLPPPIVGGLAAANRVVTEPNVITLAGRSPINVMQIIGNDITGITNGTTGEIAAIEASTLGIVQVQSIGYIKGSTPAKVVANTNLPSQVYPFNSHSHGLNIAGPVFEIYSREAIGEMNIAGEVGLIRANADGRRTSRGLEGINGVTVATTILRVDIGDGVAWAGSGLVSGGGIYANGGATGFIRQVIGRNADIRGTIASEGRIDDITLVNGSIIGANIGTPDDLSTFTPFLGLASYTDNQPLPDLTAVPPEPYVTEYSIGTVRLTGNGGIMGSRIIMGDFNAIDVRGGFGIIGSRIVSVATNNLNNVVATDGLGIRQTYISSGSGLNSLEARGEGQVLDINSYRPTVLQSVGRNRYDAFTGRLLGGSNDLHKYLGTSKTNSAISGITNSGIVENVDASGALNLGSLKAYLIRDDINNPVAPSSSRYPMRLAFANKIGKIKATSAIMGLQVRTGKLDEINAGGNMEDMSINVSGQIKTIASGRNIRGTARFEARGPEGKIDWLYARLGIYGSVTASKDIGKIQASNLGNTTQTLGKINELSISNDVLSGTYVRASDGINTLFIGGDVQSGAKISAKSYGTTTILGTNSGQVVVE